MRNQLLRQIQVPIQIVVICVVGLFLGVISAWAPPFLIIAAIAGVAYVAVAWALPEIAVLILLIFTSTIFDVDTCYTGTIKTIGMSFMDNEVVEIEFHFFRCPKLFYGPFPWCI